jgi:PhoU domain
MSTRFAGVGCTRRSGAQRGDPSYADRIASDTSQAKDMLPDIEKLIPLTEQCFVELEAAVGVRHGGHSDGPRDRRVVGADLAAAEQVITDHDHIVEMSAAAESSAINLLALQQPVAGELRDILGSLQIIADVERMSALAVHERFADHAFEVGRRVVFQVTGMLPPEQEAGM